jgi:hypothetical protein
VPQCARRKLSVRARQLTLPGPTSSGSASWVGAVVAPASPPVLTGDSNFTLSFIGVATIAPPSYGTNDLLCGMSGVVPGSTLCRYDISWSETGGQLDSIALVLFADQTDYGSVETGAPFGLTGGYLATDTDYIDDCPLSTCRITGFWQSDLAVPEPMASLLPEPMSASLLLSALLGLALVRRSLRP